MKDLDILLVNIPMVLAKVPLAGPALLKAAVQREGFTAKTVDYNILIHNNLADEPYYNDIVNFFLDTNHSAEMIALAKKLVAEWVEDIKTYNPKHVGLSIFTYQNRVAAEMFCQQLRKEMPDVKIVLGGQGIPDGGINGGTKWISKIKSLELFDYWVRSEGEEALLDILRGKYKDPIFYGHQQLLELDEIPVPDYSDYNFDLYERKVLLITGSRGCVRHCTYCDVHTHWEKFTWRQGERVAQEMIEQSKRYGVNAFVFTDSLLNGNMNEHMKFLEYMAKYNSDHKDNPIIWRGQYIIRRRKPRDEAMWELTGLAGADNLYIGVESGSASVRKHLKKEFTNDDIDYAIHQMHINGIKGTWMNLIGYPTETEQDFQDTIDMYERNVYAKDTSLDLISLGTTLSILPNTPLYNKADEYGFELNDNNENYWYNPNNPSLTFKERLRRRLYIEKYLKDLGFKIYDGNEVDTLMQLWNNYKELYEN